MLPPPLTHLRFCLAVTWLAGLAGCRLPPTAVKPPAVSPLDGLVLLEDVRPGSGIEFPLGHPAGVALGIRDTNGHPAALLDADGDGLVDVLLGGPGRVTLFRNRGSWQFAPVPDAGFRQAGYWQGAAVGDVNGDGRPDVYLSGHGCAGLYLNRGGGRFRDVTAGSGLESGLRSRWHTSAAFADVNGDGRLDLYVGAYVELGGRDGVCEPAAGIRTACGPLEFPAQKGRLYLGLGGGRFRDATAAAGLDVAHGRTLGVLFFDANGDDRPDLYLANDKMPADLFLGGAGGRFTERAAEAGVAVGPDGYAQAGMGVDSADDNGDGLPDLVVTTYQREATALYRREAPGLYTDASYSSGLGAPTMAFVGYGVRWADLDNDGHPDLVIANGHPLHRAHELDPYADYRQPFQLFRSRGDGSYAELRVCGEGLPRSIVGRALCAGDLDDDGRVDLLISDLEGQPLLLRNRTQGTSHWLSVRLESRRAWEGARVTVRAGGRERRGAATTGGSFLSAGDGRVHFGLGAAAAVESLEVRWPWEETTLLRDLDADRSVTVRAPGG